MAADWRQRPARLRAPPGAPVPLRWWPTRRAGRVDAHRLTLRSDSRRHRHEVVLAALARLEVVPDERGPYARGPFAAHSFDWGAEPRDKAWPDVVLTDRAGASITLSADNAWAPARPLWQHVYAAAEANDLTLTGNARWLIRYLAGLTDR